MNDELTAAAKIICTRLLGDTCVLVHDVGRPPCTDENCKVWPVARAALTAAAQVRERAPHMPLEPTENMLAAARDWSLGKYGKPIGNDAARGCWRVMYAAAPAPTLMPIYGATEPDSGPDVLGERKGEG